MSQQSRVTQVHGKSKDINGIKEVKHPVVRDGKKEVTQNTTTKANHDLPSGPCSLTTQQISKQQRSNHNNHNYVPS
jgi:hypothetical protein